MDALLNDLLVCPKCKGELTDLACRKCNLQYSLTEDNIPNLLIDEAASL